MRWRVKYQTLKDRIDPGGEEDNYEKSIKVDGVILAAGAWCEYLGSLVGVNIPVCNTYLIQFRNVIIKNYNSLNFGIVFQNLNDIFS